MKIRSNPSFSDIILEVKVRHGCYIVEQEVFFVEDVQVSQQHLKTPKEHRPLPFGPAKKKIKPIGASKFIGHINIVHMIIILINNIDMMKLHCNKSLCFFAPYFFTLLCPLNFIARV